MTEYREQLQVFLYKNKLNEKPLIHFFDKLSEKTIKYIAKDLINFDKKELQDNYIFSDGNCLNNGKSYAKGGYSVYFTDDQKSPLYIFNKTKLLTCEATNNKAELSGIKLIFKTVYQNQDLFKIYKNIICTDSQYAINCINVWSEKWIKNDWKNSKGESIKNKELIEEIINIKNKIPNEICITFKHVFGHTKDPIDKNTLQWKFWYGNQKVDTNINELFKLTNKNII